MTDLITNKEKRIAYKSELLRFLDDTEHYGAGTSLWMQEYPITLELMKSTIMTDFSKFNFDVLPNMKEVFLEYRKVIDDVTLSAPDLIKEELMESTSEVFDKQGDPMTLFDEKNKIALVDLKALRAHTSSLNKGSTDSITLLNQVQGIADKATNLSKEYSTFDKYVNDKCRELKKIEESDPNLESAEAAEKIMQVVGEIPIAIQKLTQLQAYGNEIAQETEKFQEQSHSLKKISDEGLKRVESLDKIFVENKDDFIASFVKCIQDIDSLHQHFTRYLLRLFHIRKEGNRNFNKKIKFDAGSKNPEDADREYMKDRLLFMKKEYPYLVMFVLSTFGLNRLRIASAHSVVNPKIEGDEIVINQVGKKDIRMNWNELNLKINSYIGLMVATGLFKTEMDEEIKKMQSQVKAMKNLIETAFKD